MPPSSSSFLFLFFFFFFFSAAAQPIADPSTPGVTISFRPGVAVVVGIFGIMFFVTFLLLVYAKFCQSAAGELFSSDRPASNAGSGLLLAAHHHRSSGIDKAAIDSLPSFRFAALRGSRGGLECAVCLARFDDADHLRLLPRCRHAFHVACVDRWLEAHSTCPLCRSRVDPDDAALFSLLPSDRLDAAPDLGLFVEREPDGAGGSSRFSIGGSFRKIGSSEGCGGDAVGGSGAQELLHKFKHRIIVSDVMFRRRWSDVNSSDLLSLSADMLSLASSKRFTELDSSTEPAGAAKHIENPESKTSIDEKILKIKKEMEKKRLLESKARQIYPQRKSAGGNASASSSSSAAINGGSRALISVPGERSMSEIVNFSRSRLVRSEQAGGTAKEENLRRIWLPIARRTLQWFAGRERRSQQSAHCMV